MKPALPEWGKYLIVLAAYAPLHWLSLIPANVIWHPPAGVRFAWLLLLPPRWWLPMAIWLQVFYRLIGRWDEGSWLGLVPFLAHFLATSSGAWVLRKRGIHRLNDTTSMIWLLGGMLISSLFNALQIVVWRPDWAHELAAGELFMQIVLGDFIGMLVVVPMALTTFRQRPQAVHWQALRQDVPLALLPLLGLLGVVLLATTHNGSYYLFAAGLSLPLAIYMAFRSGWRGVSLLLSSTSLLIGLVAWHRQNLPATLEGQLILALVGSVLLLLGTATDILREHQRELRISNQELRDAAQRNLDLSEEVRRWITSELHDELGQNLTALQTRLALVERRTDAGELLRPAWDIIDQMRNVVSSLMSGLRPAGLEEFGLVAALEQGSIRKVLEDGGLAYHLRIVDNGALFDHLDDRAQTALYRIVQEAATNAVRHANARNFHVQLRSGHGKRISLLVGDDGKGLSVEPRKGGMGLQGIRDRVLSLGGRLRTRGIGQGMWLLVRIDIP